MKKSIPVLITASSQERIQLVTREYFNTPEKIAELIEALPRLTKFLGKQKITELITQLKEGKLREVFAFLFLNYYDSKYQHTLKELNFVFEMDHADFAKLETFYAKKHHMHTSSEKKSLGNLYK